MSNHNIILIEDKYWILKFPKLNSIIFFRAKLSISIFFSDPYWLKGAVIEFDRIMQTLLVGEKFINANSDIFIYTGASKNHRNLK